MAARCHKNRGAPGHGLVSLGLAAAVIKSKLKLKPRAAESGEETKLEKQSQNKNRNKRHQQDQHCTGPLTASAHGGQEIGYLPTAQQQPRVQRE